MARVENCSGRTAAAALTEAECACVIWNSRSAVASTEIPSAIAAVICASYPVPGAAKAAIEHAISIGTFDYAVTFPSSARAAKFAPEA